MKTWGGWLSGNVLEDPSLDPKNHAKPGLVTATLYGELGRDGRSHRSLVDTAEEEER